MAARAEDAATLNHDAVSFKPRAVKLLGTFVFTSLLALLVLAAIPYGTAEAWWKALLVCSIFALTIIWLIEGFLSGHWISDGWSMILPMLALAVFSFLQTLPIGQIAIAGVGTWNTISADPLPDAFLCIAASGANTRRSSPSTLRVHRRTFTNSHPFRDLCDSGQCRVRYSSTNSAAQDWIWFASVASKQRFRSIHQQTPFCFPDGDGAGVVTGNDFWWRHQTRTNAHLPRSYTAYLDCPGAVGIKGRPCFHVGPGNRGSLTIPADGPDASDTNPFKSFARPPIVACSSRYCCWSLSVQLLLDPYGWEAIGWQHRLRKRPRDFGAENIASRQGASRNEIWRVTLRMFAAHPVFGVGMGGYWAAVPEFHDAVRT